MKFYQKFSIENKLLLILVSLIYHELLLNCIYCLNNFPNFGCIFKRIFQHVFIVCIFKLVMAFVSLLLHFLHSCSLTWLKKIILQRFLYIKGIHLFIEFSITFVIQGLSFSLALENFCWNYLGQYFIQFCLLSKQVQY